HNSNFFSDKLVLTSVTPASSAPVLQTPKATSSTLYFDSLTVNAGNGGFLHCIQMDTSVNAANQVVSVGADIAFDADPKFFVCFFSYYIHGCFYYCCYYVFFCLCFSCFCCHLFFFCFFFLFYVFFVPVSPPDFFLFLSFGWSLLWFLLYRQIVIVVPEGLPRP